MTTRSRAYRATHDPDQTLAPALHEFKAEVDAHHGVDAAGVKRIAEAIKLPIATVRGAVSSFDDCTHDPSAIRVCSGTSCSLAGGGEIARELSKTHACQGVYCLGYCDRSPVAMTPAGHVVPSLSLRTLGALTPGATPPHPAPSSIRTASRHAIVTARLAGNTSSPEAVPDYTGLRAALRLSPEKTVEVMLAAGIKGRGGAAYPTGRKWQLAAKAAGSPKYVVANGDEGDPGSFIDRELMERDPHSIIEGMAICAHSIGAAHGYVFIRSEYPVSSDVMTRAIAAATAAGFLGSNALGAGKPFTIEIIRGMGSYVCGEETALLAAIEGQRGEVWPRPPFPVDAGLFGKPTVVDNVETLNNIPWIFERGADAYAAVGTADSKGTKALCFNHGFAKPGIVEIDFGVTLRSAIEELAGGSADGRPLEAVLLGGPMGSIVTPDQWDAPICFASMARRGITLGHGGMIAIPRGVDWRALLHHLLTFMRDESCGKCVPCRMGTIRAHELSKKGLTRNDAPQLERILALMKEASLCAFGRETPGPVKTILEKFAPSAFAETRP